MRVHISQGMQTLSLDFSKKARFFGLFCNETRQNGNEQNCWNMKQEKKTIVPQNGLKTERGFFFPLARRENFDLPRMRCCLVNHFVIAK